MSVSWMVWYEIAGCACFCSAAEARAHSIALASSGAMTLEVDVRLMFCVAIMFARGPRKHDCLGGLAVLDSLSTAPPAPPRKFCDGVWERLKVRTAASQS